MVPSSIIGLPSLPYKISGKLDHSAVMNNMRAYLGTHAGNDSPKLLNAKLYIVPQGFAGPKNENLLAQEELQSAIAQLWQEQLGLTTPPGDDTNFFDIGGHDGKSPYPWENCTGAKKT